MPPPGGSGPAHLPTPSLASVLPEVLLVSLHPLVPQIAQERKTQLEAAPETKVKSSQPEAGSQGPQTFRQGVGKYINPAAT